MKKIIAVITSILIVCSLITPLTLSVLATGTPLTGLYHEKFYTTYGATGYDVTFDPDAETITTANKQTRALINYSRDMTTFDAEVSIKSNMNTGLIQAGLAFHVQDATLTTTYNPNSGYFVFVRRNTSNLSKLEIVVRYYKDGVEQKAVVAKSYTGFVTDKNVTVKLKLSVTETGFKATVFDDVGTQLMETNEYLLDDYGMYFDKGALVLTCNGAYVFSNFNVTAYGAMANIPGPEDMPGYVPPVIDPLAEKYTVYGTAVTEGDYSNAESSIVRGVLKNTENTADFSTDLVLKIDAEANLKSGLIFRVKSAGASTDDMQGYALIAQKMTSGADNGKIRLYLYKYGIYESANAYLGRIAYIAHDFGTITAGNEFTLHLNVAGEKIEAYCFSNANPEAKSAVLKASLKDAANSDKDNPEIYYDKGSVGFYAATGYVKALGLTLKPSEEIKEDPKPELEPEVIGRPAVDKQIGSAIKGNAGGISDVKENNIDAVTVKDLAEYAADFDNYTYYSSSTTNKFLRTDEGIASTTTGAKRAILDGVTVKGFHATATMKIGSEGTLRSGIIFRVNNIEKGVDENGTLGANDIEGYTAVLYKTPGSTKSHARVVICIYKYGIKNGAYQYLGMVASKASEVPLKGCEANITDAVGKELTIDVNVVDNQVTAYFYNTNDPTLVSEKLIADLTDETDSESKTPSLKGVHYNSGSIGLTATDYVTFKSFTVSEPIYPSNLVGDLSDLDSYTIFGSGVTKEGDYFVANSSGTKKMIVNSLTVKDFTASVDMTIDDNGNLKSGFFFRATEVGNGADAQKGYAIIVSRNFTTNGQNNPNRIDIVIFKWGYLNGKLSYLGEVAREAYKSGKTFMDGKMAGEELTFVIRVKGAAIDASLYKKNDIENKPATFSTNLKFATSKEKDGAAYYESGSIGLYLGNSTSEPLNTNKLRNFRVDDGSGVLVKASNKGLISGLFDGIPTTGETVVVIAVAMAFIIALGAILGLSSYKKDRHIRGYRR